MNKFTELIKSVSAEPVNIVHLGAGMCAEHKSYRSISSGRIIYVEADPNRAEAASERFRHAPNVKVIQSAIVAKNSEYLLNVTNNWRFSSLLLPGILLEFFPNIKVEAQVGVVGITLSKLCRGEDIIKESDNLLIAELQGMEKEVFPQAQIDTLQRFKWIIIRSSEIDLYTPVPGEFKKGLLESMRNAGFTVLIFEEDAPPLVNYLCVRNDESIDYIRLKARESDLMGAVTELADSVKNKSEEVTVMQQTLHINNKLMLKSDIDLRNLQEQYKSVLQKQEQQHNLLSELRGKLQEASVFYQKLNLENLEFDIEILKQDNNEGIESDSDYSGDSQPT